jgi:hypothetical protein
MLAIKILVYYIIAITIAFLAGIGAYKLTENFFIYFLACFLCGLVLGNWAYKASGAGLLLRNYLERKHNVK